MRSKPKIIQFIHGLTSGGAETLVKDYALELKRRGYDVRILVITSYPQMSNQIAVAQAGIPIISLFESGKDPFMHLPRPLRILFRESKIRQAVKHYLIQEQPDILHIHLPLVRYLIGCDRVLSSTRILYTCHSTVETIFLNKKAVNQIDRWALYHFLRRGKCRIIALHSEMAEQINTLFGVQNTASLPNPINLARLQNSGVTKSDYRTVLGIPQNSFVLGHIGRFVAVKNHNFLLQVFQNIREKDPRAFLLLVGDGPLKSTIVKTLNAMGAEGHYLILSNRCDVPQILTTMDFFCFPSLWEGLGTVVLEAQGAGLSCLISDKVPSDVILTDRVKQLPATDPALWAEEILHPSRSKDAPHGNLRDCDIKSVVDKLLTFYFE